MVIVIMSIVTVIALPHIDHVIQHQKLHNEAQRLAWVLRSARQQAITSGVSSRVEFYYYTNRYDVNYQTRYFLPDGITYRAKPTFIHQGSHNIYCIFAPSGAPSPGGTVCLTNRNGELIYIIVNLPAGRVRVSDTPPNT
jgi:Tfp pilus assembly protein FimT